MTDTSRYDAYSRPIAVPAAVPVPADVELKQLTNVARPVLTGNSVTGSLMTVTAGTWSEPAENLTITYDWLSPDGKVSSGGDSFVPNNTHVGSTITVLVTVSAPGYATSRVKVTAQKPVTAADPYQTKSPSINGVLRMGLIVEVSGGEWSDYPAGLSGTWQWLRDDVPVKGATGGSYHLRAEDVGKRISVSHTVTLNGRVLKTETVGAGSVAPAFLKAAKPTISGTVKVGKVLTARPGAWTQGTSFKYRWLRNGVPISGATSSTYKVRTADRDKRITVEVTGSRLGYTTVTQTSGAYFAR
ncbi:hypothetical protein [Arthrobacter sp. H-02-3]|uniref:hypothetical protein n=1 Tax=Arthrobacter sp. H-02-3 TaxID=2703675 RepID=UPI001F1B0555|nr:hypothetical protein [Arthrobacter sp. H-02-3]